MWRAAPRGCRSLAVTRQLRNLCKKTATAPGRGCREPPPPTARKVSSGTGGLGGAEGRAALWAETEVCELKRQSHQLRQRLAQAFGATVPPIPRGLMHLLLLLQAPGVPEGPGLPCVSRSPRREKGGTRRAPAPEVTCISLALDAHRQGTTAPALAPTPQSPIRPRSAHCSLRSAQQCSFFRWR